MDLHLEGIIPASWWGSLVMNKRTVFLTGATGLIGSYLLKVLLHNGYKVYVLARRKDGKNARERVLEVLNFWNKDVLSTNVPQDRYAELQNRYTDILKSHAEFVSVSPETLKQVQDNILNERLTVLEGDITEKDLGLSKKDIDLLKNEIEEIFHSAALTQFNLPLRELRKVNVEGTKNVLELAVKCGTLKKVNHLSTAYVCGDYKGVFKEDDLDLGQKFNSTYEQSKFEAEKLADEYRKRGLWIDVFRPPLVVGESLTGKTVTFQQGVYQLLHMWGLEVFDYFPGKGYFIDMVYVDELCNALFNISQHTSNPNKTYHLFNKVVPFETILNISSDFLGFKKPILLSTEDFFKHNPTPAQRMLLQNNILLFNNDAELSSEETNAILKGYGFEFSSFSRASFLKLLKYCVRKGFLKRKNLG